MKPDTHTFWDPERGRYVTLGRCPKPQGSGVPTPAPTDDAEFRRKAVVAADAVVSSFLNALLRGFLIAIAIVVLLIIAGAWQQNVMDNHRWTHHEDATGKWIPDKWN